MLLIASIGAIATINIAVFRLPTANRKLKTLSGFEFSVFKGASVHLKTAISPQ